MPSILVIDDDKPHAEVVVSALERIAASCDVAHSEKQAIAILEKNPDKFDVVVTEIFELDS